MHECHIKINTQHYIKSSLNISQSLNKLIFIYHTSLNVTHHYIHNNYTSSNISQITLSQIIHQLHFLK